jgi:hypothetical protein
MKYCINSKLTFPINRHSSRCSLCWNKFHKNILPLDGRILRARKLSSPKNKQLTKSTYVNITLITHVRHKTTFILLSSWQWYERQTEGYLWEINLLSLFLLCVKWRTCLSYTHSKGFLGRGDCICKEAWKLWKWHISESTEYTCFTPSPRDRRWIAFRIFCHKYIPAACPQSDHN